MNYILHRSGSGRFVLQSTTTGNLIGFTIHPSPTESRQMFAYDLGTVYDRSTLSNLDQFPELADLPFFAIEYPSHHDFTTCLRSESWSNLHNLFLAEAKAIGYNGNYSQPPLPNALSALWQYTPTNPAGLWKMPAWGLWVDDDGVWLGNRQGIVIKFNHDGAICQQWNLSKSVWNLCAHQGKTYASCDDGYIYDLSGKLPEIFYQARWDRVSQWSDFHIDGFSCHENQLHIIDGYGKLTQVKITPVKHCQTNSIPKSVQWEKETNFMRNWFLAADEHQLYQGHSQGIHAYDRTSGKLIWAQMTESQVLCGVMTDDALIIGCSNRWLYRVVKNGDLKAKTTTITPLAQCMGGIYSCTRSDDGAYIFVSDHESYLYAFTPSGELLWQRPTGCGAALNLQWHRSPCGGERLYATTTEGTLAVFAVDAATMQHLSLDHQTHHELSVPTALPPSPKPKKRKPKPDLVADESGNISTTEITAAAIVECVLIGSKVRVRVISDGYHKDWSVQFPTKLRQVGAKYRVAKLTPVPEKNFYRASGTIERLADLEHD
ncbi:MAG: hypothetical protein WCO45_11765 [Pseudanabaena sp. ELA607]